MDIIISHRSDFCVYISILTPVEPSSTKKNREHIKEVIDKNKKNYAFHVKVQRVEQIKYERKIFDAYKNGTLMEFINKNKDKLINYKK